MNEPELAITRVDTERVVRELLCAFDSLKSKAPCTCSSPEEKGRPEERQPTRPPQSCEGRSKAFKVVDGALSTISADQRHKPRTPLEALTARSYIDEAKSKQISAFECAENSKTRDDEMKAQLSQQEIIEEFLGDHELIERLRVTPQEIQSLSSSALLGSLTCKQDMLFILRLLREGPKSAKPQATVPPEPLHVQDENIEPSIPDPSELAERIRLESLARLNESDSLKGIVRRSALQRYGVFSSAIVLMTVTTWNCITLMLDWQHHLSAKLALPVFKILVGGEILLVASVVVGIYLRQRRRLPAKHRYNLIGIWFSLYRSLSRTS